MVILKPCLWSININFLCIEPSNSALLPLNRDQIVGKTKMELNEKINEIMDEFQAKIKDTSINNVENVCMTNQHVG